MKRILLVVAILGLPLNLGDVRPASAEVQNYTLPNGQGGYLCGDTVVANGTGQRVDRFPNDPTNDETFDRIRLVFGVLVPGSHGAPYAVAITFREVLDLDDFTGQTNNFVCNDIAEVPDDATGLSGYLERFVPATGTWANVQGNNAAGVACACN